MTPPTTPPSTSEAITGWRRLADRRTLAIVVVVTGLVVLGACGLVVAGFTDELPDPVAVHWGTDGADGFAAPGSATTWALLLVGVTLVIGLGVMTATLGRSASTRRLLAGTTLGSAVMLGVAQVASLAAQRGLADAHDAPDAGVALGLVAGLVAGLVVGLVLPGDARRPATAVVADDAERVELADDERAVWIARTAGGPGPVVMLSAIALTVVLAVVTQLWWLLAATVLLVVLFATMFSWVVRADAAGLTVRASVGWPRTHVRADEIVRASATDVSPMRDFGGWGWRVGRGGRVGVVVRRGPALLVEQTGGRSIVVTIDDPAEGAALLNTLADRARRARS